MTAADRLTDALASAAARGQATPCQGSHSARWTSDDADEQEWAAHMCRTCTVLPLCAAMALEIKATAGVWAGMPRARPTRGPNRNATKTNLTKAS